MQRKINVIKNCLVAFSEPYLKIAHSATTNFNPRWVYRQERPLGSRETGVLFPVGSY